MPSKNEEIITIDEAEKRFGISRDGLYNYVRSGNLTTYVKVAELEALTDLNSETGIIEGEEVAEANYRPDPEELAELIEAVAISEAEDAQGFYITHEQIKERIAERIANHRLKREQLGA